MDRPWLSLTGEKKVLASSLTTARATARRFISLKRPVDQQLQPQHEAQLSCDRWRVNQWLVPLPSRNFCSGRSCSKGKRAASISRGSGGAAPGSTAACSGNSLVSVSPSTRTGVIYTFCAPHKHLRRPKPANLSLSPLRRFSRIVRARFAAASTSSRSCRPSA